MVTESAIAASTLDMNLNAITSVADPVLPQDAATRFYVDSSVQKVESQLESLFSGLRVTLSGTGFADVAHIKPGSYIITVTPYQDGYPTATFSISKASTYSIGHVARLTSGPGNYTPEQLELQWPEGGMLILRKNGPGYDGDYLVDMNVKNMSTLPAPPILPTDQATKAYVDKVVKETLDIKFGGMTVNLVSTNLVNVIHLRPGSYIIAVTPIGMDGGPTATFSVSKNSISVDATVKKITECVGISTPEQLEMEWPIDSMLMLRKTGSGYDGEYLVDMNLKNFSSQPIVSEPDDGWNLSKGITITLSGNNYAPVVALGAGSYVLAVSPAMSGGPTAVFTISKSRLDMEPSVFKLTSSLGYASKEDLEVIWPPNSKIYVRKTGNNYDGLYIVDTTLRNMTMFPENFVSEPVTGGATTVGTILQYNFALYGTEETLVAYVDPGYYLVFISATEAGVYNATFSVSKSMVIPMVVSGQYDGNFAIEIRWSDDNRLFVRKSISEHDGLYIMKLM